MHLGDILPPYETKKIVDFHKFFLLLYYQNKRSSVKFWYLLVFYLCYGSKRGHQNRLNKESNHF